MLGVRLGIISVLRITAENEGDRRSFVQNQKKRVTKLVGPWW